MLEADHAYRGSECAIFCIPLITAFLFLLATNILLNTLFSTLQIYVP